MGEKAEVVATAKMDARRLANFIVDIFFCASSYVLLQNLLYLSRPDVTVTLASFSRSFSRSSQSDYREASQPIVQANEAIDCLHAANFVATIQD